MSELPITVKRSIELMGLCLLGAIVVIGQNIIMPVLLAFFLSIMLLPVYRFLKKHRFPETLAIFLPILFCAILVATIIWFFTSQVNRLVDDYPEIQKNISLHLNTISNWINQKTNFSTQEQLNFINKQSNKLLTNAGNLVGGAATSISSVFLYIGLVPIYIYLF